MMFVDGWSPTLVRIQTRRPDVIWKIGAYRHEAVAGWRPQ